jgi:GT2 family glycosyltransferase
MILFDIIVPTYNRYPQLHEFFKGNKSLANDPLIRFWLVDDCSTNFDRSAVPPWENLTLLRLERNHGQAFARNVAIEKGLAPYIISLDDDAWFEGDPSVLDDIISAFRRYPDAGCFMFNIATPSSRHSNIPTGTEIPLSIACGCAWRRTAIEDIGGFNGFLHSGAEETDNTLKLLGRGWKTRQLESVKVFHNFIHQKRSLQWHYNVRHNTTRNDMLIVIMYYPWIYVPVFIIGKFISHLLYAIKNGVAIIGTLWHTITAFFDFLVRVPRALKHRRPLGVKQFKRWRSLLKQI